MSRNENRRVVITGLGVVSSLGIGWQEFWKNLLAGKSGISKITTFDTSSYDRHYGGEVKKFDPVRFMSKRKAVHIGRASQLSIAATKLALEDANIHLNERVKKKIMLSVGTTGGERRLIEKFNNDIVLNRKITLVKEQLNACTTENLASCVGVELGLKGYVNVFSTACAAGNYALGEGFDLIKSGKFDYALVGGADSFSQMVCTGFGRLYAIAPEKCQPFDRNRQGMIPAEGAGFLFLEPLDIANDRKAHIYAEVRGYGLSCDARHMTNPSVDGVTKAITKALKNSGITPDEVDYISAHGTGTKENDEAECQAINRVFGKRTQKIPVSSIKSMLGHTMGAAAALETIACCLAIKDGKVPPTINHEEDDPACDIDCVPNKSRKHAVQVALNNSQAFGGNNACVVLRDCCDGQRL